jgi:hypothetical protein
MMWNEIKEFADIMWGESWTGIESIGRYMTLLFVAAIIGAIWFYFWAKRSDQRFIDSCYARGGHVHYEHERVAGPVIVSGDVGIPIPVIATTMVFAEGREEDCDQC